MTEPNPNLVHGRRSTYVNHKCHCPPCREANTAGIRRRRQERYAETQASGLPPGIEHGESAYSNWGCRCDICSSAQKIKNGRRPKGKAT